MIISIEKRAQSFAMAYTATAEHTGENVHEWRLKAVVEEYLKAAVQDDREARPELKTALDEQRASIAEMLAVEARRLRGLYTIVENPDPYMFAAEICETLERTVRG